MAAKTEAGLRAEIRLEQTMATRRKWWLILQGASRHLLDDPDVVIEEGCNHLHLSADVDENTSVRGAVMLMQDANGNFIPAGTEDEVKV